MSYEIIGQFNPAPLIASNGEYFFACGYYTDSYEYHRSYNGDGSNCHTVVSQSLDQLAHGAPKYKTLSALKKALNIPKDEEMLPYE